MIKEKIIELKKKRNAVILAHNYCIGEVQDIADFAGDSLGLSKQAAQTDADVIVFCGVHFMAETAKILSPQKTVLIPEASAGCPMADMITEAELVEFKAKYPDAVVVCYVNSSAKVKALSDYCCTSGNAVELVANIEQGKQILFVPDRNLGSYVKEMTGRDIVLWQGYCPIHEVITDKKISAVKQEHPEARVLAHPECPETARHLADELLSTAQMLDYIENSDDDEFVIATESGIIHAIEKRSPKKEFYEASSDVCVDMKKITLEKVLLSLENMQHEVVVDLEVAKKARRSLDRMLEVLPVASEKKSN